MDPSLIQNLDATLHEKRRLLIASVLNERGRVSFVELKTTLGMTDGNLSLHLKTLERKGYLELAKRRENGRLRTICSLTAAGRNALHDYMRGVEAVLEQIRRDDRRGRGRGGKRHLN